MLMYAVDNINAMNFNKSQVIIGMLCTTLTIQNSGARRRIACMLQIGNIDNTDIIVLFLLKLKHDSVHNTSLIENIPLNNDE